jgi:hypothetical protein
LARSGETVIVFVASSYVLTRSSALTSASTAAFCDGVSTSYWRPSRSTATSSRKATASRCGQSADQAGET